MTRRRTLEYQVEKRQRKSARSRETPEQRNVRLDNCRERMRKLRESTSRGHKIRKCSVRQCDLDSRSRSGRTQVIASHRIPKEKTMLGELGEVASKAHKSESLYLKEYTEMPAIVIKMEPDTEDAFITQEVGAGFMCIPEPIKADFGWFIKEEDDFIVKTEDDAYEIMIKQELDIEPTVLQPQAALRLPSPPTQMAPDLRPMSSMSSGGGRASTPLCTGRDDEATTSTSTGSRGPRGKNAQYYRDYRARKRAEQEKESLNRTSDPSTTADSSTINVAGSVTSKKRKSAAEYQREYRARKKAKRDNILIDSLAVIPSTSTGRFTTTHQSTIVDQLTTAGSSINPQTTAGPSINPQTTAGPSINPQTTAGPSINSQTTAGPSINPQTTAGPSINPQTTAGPSINPQTTAGPSINPQTTAGPSINPQTTAGPSINPQTTAASSINPQTTAEPSINPPTTAGPSTSSDIGFAKPTRRKTPAEYQREYRARKKAQRESMRAAKTNDGSMEIADKNTSNIGDENARINPQIPYTRFH